MKTRLLHYIAFALSACSSGLPLQSSPEEAARVAAVEQTYLACLTREAAALGGSPVSVDEIANAAHGRCWENWTAYRQVTYETFVGNARTDDERQLARDKAEAQLREFEVAARRTAAQTAIQNSRKPTPLAP